MKKDAIAEYEKDNGNEQKKNKFWGSLFRK
jgi:hypothetical protein